MAKNTQPEGPLLVDRIDAFVAECNFRDEGSNHMGKLQHRVYLCRIGEGVPDMEAKKPLGVVLEEIAGRASDLLVQCRNDAQRRKVLDALRGLRSEDTFVSDVRDRRKGHEKEYLFQYALNKTTGLLKPDQYHDLMVRVMNGYTHKLRAQQTEEVVRLLDQAKGHFNLKMRDSLSGGND